MTTNETTLLMKSPIRNFEPLTVKNQAEKSGRPPKAPISGVIRSLTAAWTTAPNAAPITTATARSTTLPRNRNFWNPPIVSLPMAEAYRGPADPAIAHPPAAGRSGSMRVEDRSREPHRERPRAPGWARRRAPRVARRVGSRPAQGRARRARRRALAGARPGRGPGRPRGAPLERRAQDLRAGRRAGRPRRHRLLEARGAALPIRRARRLAGRTATGALLRRGRAGRARRVALARARARGGRSGLVARTLGPRRPPPRPVQRGVPGRPAAAPSRMARRPAAAHVAGAPPRAPRADRGRAGQPRGAPLVAAAGRRR